MIYQVPFCRQQSSGRVALIGECLPFACDDAAVVRLNPDPFFYPMRSRGAVLMSLMIRQLSIRPPDVTVAHV
jgi:hypothetical protein